MRMDYQITVISEMHNDANGNAVKGSSPLNIDSFDVTQRGRSTIKVENRWCRPTLNMIKHIIKYISSKIVKNIGNILTFLSATVCYVGSPLWPVQI